MTSSSLLVPSILTICVWFSAAVTICSAQETPAQQSQQPVPVSKEQQSSPNEEQPSPALHDQPAQQPQQQAQPQQPRQQAVPRPAAGTANLSGRITDLSKERNISDVRIVLEKKGEEHKRHHTETAADGTFLIKDLEPGEWSITFSHKEMLSETREFTVAAGEQKIFNLGMEDIEPVDVLRITGKRTLIHPEKIGSTTNLDKTFLQQYRSGNDLRNLIESTPGVINDSYGNMIVRGEHNAINYEVDGVVLPESAGVLQQTQFATPRSLQSISVDIGGYQASDGGGPLGAVVRMKSLPIQAKPVLTVGQQIGGPLAGNLYYYASGAFSQNVHSKWNKLRIESSGQFMGTRLGLSPPVKNYIRNNRANINTLTKLEYHATDKDLFRLTAGINESWMQVPTSRQSYGAGVRQRQFDQEIFLIATYRRKFEKFFDEGRLHLINAFYNQRFRSNNAFDPSPIINGEGEGINSVSPRAARNNYVFGAQGDITKRLFETHNLKAGFLSEIRPVSTRLGALYYNANMLATIQSQRDAQDQISGVFADAQQAAQEAGQAAFTQEFDASGDIAAAQQAAQQASNQILLEAQTNAGGINPNPLPYGAIISPFTGLPGGPQFTEGIGRYKGFRYLQSAFLQDTWRPKTGILKRLTLDGGARFDLYHGVFGNTLPVAAAIATIPDVQPFLLEPFKRHTVTDAQVSARVGGSFVLTRNTVMRGSFSQLFTPPPVDVFSTPPNVAEGAIGGISNGTVRPLRATRGELVDVSVEQQVGPRFVTRTNLYYKRLKNFGDSGVLANTPVYNRLSLNGLESYGVETRVDLKPSKEGYGFNGFLSNTFQVAFLRGFRGATGGIYEQSLEPILRNYPDHDRRYQLSGGLGYRARKGWWVLGDLQVMTGLQNGLDPALFGPHPSRTAPITLAGLSLGYNTPKRFENKKSVPRSFDVRIENLLNQRVPTNLGSPFQGTRYMLPIRVLVGCNWQI